VDHLEDVLAVARLEDAGDAARGAVIALLVILLLVRVLPPGPERRGVDRAAEAALVVNSRPVRRGAGKVLDYERVAEGVNT
jgi:hypothetical protein